MMTKKTIREPSNCMRTNTFKSVHALPTIPAQYDNVEAWSLETSSSCLSWRLGLKHHIGGTYGCGKHRSSQKHRGHEHNTPRHPVDDEQSGTERGVTCEPENP